MRLCSRVFFETTLYSNIFTPLYSKLSEISIQVGSTTSRRIPIQARWEEHQSKHFDASTPICHKRRSTLSVFDPSTARRTPIQACRPATSADPLSLSLLVCPYVGVFGFVVSLGDFVVDFWFCLWECVYQRKKQMMRGCWLCRWRRERKKRAKLEIIIIIYRRATVIVYICMVTIAHGNF